MSVKHPARKHTDILVTGIAVSALSMIVLGTVYGWQAVAFAVVACIGVVMALVALEVNA